MEDKQLIMNMTLYASDHASPCKNSMLYFKWMAAEMEEYYQQGDLERKLDYTVTPFFDRAQCNPFKFQLGYIDVIVKPLFQAYCEFKENLNEDMIEKGIDENRKMLESKIEETKNLQASSAHNQMANHLNSNIISPAPKEVQQDVPAEGEADKKNSEEIDKPKQGLGKSAHVKSSSKKSSVSKASDDKSKSKRSQQSMSTSK